MEFKKDYSLHTSFKDAKNEYGLYTRNNDDFKSAMNYKNIEYFNGFKNGILCITIFKFYKSYLNSGNSFSTSCGLLCFYDDFAGFSQRKGFGYTRGVINYSDVEELSVFVKGGLISSFTGFDNSSVVFFLKNQDRILFDLRNFDAAYILSQTVYLGSDNRFPFFLADEIDGRYIFKHK